MRLQRNRPQTNKIRKLCSPVSGVQLILPVEFMYQFWKLDNISLSKYRIQILKVSPFRQWLYGHTGLMLEAHLLQANQPDPQYMPMYRSLSSPEQNLHFSGKALLNIRLQTKCKLPLFHVSNDGVPTASGHSSH